MVLCVHGIGNQREGETVDDVLGGALAEHNRVYPDSQVVADETIVTLFEDEYASYDGTAKPQSKTYPGGARTITFPDGSQRVLPDEVDTPVHDAPNDDPEREGVQEKFSMHVKRVRKQYRQEVETVMAEVYWADLSPEPKGAFATIFDLIKVVASIGYLALDNAANVGSKRGYNAVCLFLWLIIGGVAALNATLLFGVVALLLEGRLYSFDSGGTGAAGAMGPAVMVISVIAGVFGLFANVTGNEKAWSLFGRVTDFAMIIAAVGVIFGLIPNFAGALSLSAPETALALTGIFTILFGRMIGRNKARWALSLWRMNSIGAGGWGLIVLIYIPFLPDPEAVLASCKAATESVSPFCKSINGGNFGPEATQIFFFVNLLMHVLAYALMASMVACFLTYLAWALDKDKVEDSAPPQQRRMYATICSGLVLLWVIMASSFWVGMHSATDSLNFKELGAEQCLALPVAEQAEHHCHETTGILTHVFEDFIEGVAPTMAVAVLFLFVLGVAGGAIVILRHMNKHVLFMMAQSKPLIGRLLLNGGVQVIFAVSTVVLFVVALLFRLDWYTLDKDSSETLSFVVQFVPPILLAIALIVYQMRDLVAGGLGAFRDIVVYANNNKLKADFGSEEKNRNNFPPRKQIEGRFERVARLMINQVKPKRLTVICHSQGTVVSTRNVRRLKAAGVFDGIDVTVVTMGSPVTHLYRKYFPRDFRIEPADWEGVRWFNIGRTDDFVGTYIENLDALNGKPNQPVEKSEYNLMVPAGGHPGYFTDPYVWQHFSKRIGFKLVDV
ncbi:hypothetical protein AIOL_001237 [Candidatus Rhodobacter oscarellae]|uniref:Uncharacterized protein n=1 Tax=Candidatus Rhodobacter oscarellae TaxID=1675527 RepID=A0A0J9E0N4_9RHOB|nr:hypothetical protein AIOL_001237 [Candidatus Rhodobacter lobularis]